MNLFLIKIGKAWQALKRDGLWRGGQRVVRSFFLLFRRVKPGDILFISGGVGDSARYRTKHVAEELGLHGFRVSSTVQDNPFLLSYAEKFSVFVFHRTLYTPKVAQLMKELEALEKTVIFDTDDLVYDPAYLQDMDYYTQMNVLERKLYEHGLGGEIVNNPLVKTCTTSTNFLANKLREKGKQVFLVRNKLSEEDVLAADQILIHKKTASSPLHIGYLSGTPSHNKDFATITDALLVLFERYPTFHLFLVGPLDTEETLNRFQDRIERVPFLPRQEYFATLAEMDINLAPLEIGNPFCEAKSELKWFESGLVAVPTVASATGTFMEAIQDGVDGFVAATTEEWVEKLSLLVDDQELRKKMGLAAREKVLEQYTTKHANNSQYYEFLSEKIKNK